MYSFSYQKAKTVADAAKVLAKDGDAKLLAGGQSLIAAMKLRLAHPSAVIDLGTIKELSGIKGDSKADAIGAMTRHRSEERRVGKSVDLGGRRITKKKSTKHHRQQA